MKCNVRPYAVTGTMRLDDDNEITTYFETSPIRKKRIFHFFFST